MGWNDRKQRVLATWLTRVFLTHNLWAWTMSCGWKQA